MYDINPGLPGVGGGGDWDGLEQSPFWSHEDVADFKKAVTAGYGDTMSSLTGGGALRLQSLEGTLLTTLQENRHFVLFNALEKSNAGATVDEYSVKEAIGGFPGSAYNSEVGDIPEDAGDYKRKVGLVKYLMTMRSVSAVQRSQKTLIDAMADQNVDATLELLSSAEWGLFYGDSDCSSVEFDGIKKQIEDHVAAEGETDRILDLRGKSISAAAQEFIESAQYIAEYGNFGQATDVLVSNAMQADLDQKLDPAYRVNIGGAGNQDIKLGTPVNGIRTSWGNLTVRNDVFIQEGGKPFAVRGAAFLKNVNANLCAPPTSITASAGAASGTSQWAAEHAGNYYWAVEAGNKAGHSSLVKSAQEAVAAGETVTLTIVNGATTGTCYHIYRSRRDGTNADADLREMIRVPVTAGANTVVLDNNADIPGTSIIPILTLAPGRKAITLRRLMPMSRFNLYPTNKAVYPWAQLMFCYLRMGKIRHHRLIKNALPSGQSWKPFA